MHPGCEELSLNAAATHLLEECRTVLPGIQALFGFQLIAVFNQRFAAALSRNEQILHLGAIALVVIAIALVMAPAALHRHTEPCSVSQRFIDAASTLLMWSMVPLALGTSIDLYLVARITFDANGAALAVAAALLSVMSFAWFILPRSRALQDWLGKSA